MTGHTDPSGSVVHVVRRFGEPSQVWLGDLIAASDRYAAVVACETDLRAATGAPRALEVLPSQYPVVPFRLQRWWSEHGYRPLNPWKRALLAGVLPESDLVHAHFGHIGWRCVDAGLNQVVTTFYGFDMSVLPRQRRWRGAYRSLFSRGAAFLAEGPAMRDALIALGAPRSRTHLQPLVADIDEDPRPPDPTGPPVVLMAGRFVEKKGFVDGVRAFSTIAPGHADAQLMIVGSGPEEASITDAVGRSPARDRIHMRGFMDREGYRELLRRATILLQPSRTASDGDSEGGAPTTLLDAQALGKVIVASRHADIPFVVDPEAAYLADEFDLEGLTRQLDTALSEPDSWSDRGEQGRRHVVAQHSRRSVAAALEGVYDSIAGSASRSPSPQLGKDTT